MGYIGIPLPPWPGLDSASERSMSQNSFSIRSLSDSNQMSTEPDYKSPIKE